MNLIHISRQRWQGNRRHEDDYNDVGWTMTMMMISSDDVALAITIAIDEGSDGVAGITWLETRVKLELYRVIYKIEWYWKTGQFANFV